MLQGTTQHFTWEQMVTIIVLAIDQALIKNVPCNLHVLLITVYKFWKVVFKLNIHPAIRKYDGNSDYMKNSGYFQFSLFLKQGKK